MNESSEKKRLPFWIATLLTLWMLAVMLFGWIVMEGPIVCSVVKRSEPLKAHRQTWVLWLGKTPKEVSK